MAQSFQFDIYGAPQADPSAGFAAYSQGMGNAANLIAQSGSQFSALRGVAQDFLRYQNQRQLQDQEIAARKEYQDAWLAIQREQMKERMGYKANENELARGNLRAREAGLELQAARDVLSAERAANEREKMEMQRANQDRLSAQQQLRMMGVQGDTTPGNVLQGIDDPARRGETEGLFRELFRRMGGGQASSPGMGGPGGSPMDALGVHGQRPPAAGLLPHGNAARGGPSGAGRSTAPGASAEGARAEGGLDAVTLIADDVIAQAKANGWTIEQARAEVRRRLKAAGYE